MKKKDPFLGCMVTLYRIDESIGETGVTFLYRARDTHLGVDVALKIMKPQYSRNEDLQALFVREFDLTADFRHPNVILIHHLGKDNDTVFMAMDLLETSLKDLMVPGKPMDEDLIIKVGMDVASGLQYVHTEGHIVHRDVQPENIRFDSDGNAVLTGFDIAEPLTPDAGKGVFAGNAKYMSPEQAQAYPVDHRADIYSLGVTLYEMATGRLPFTGRGWFKLARKHVEELPTPPRDKNPALDPDIERVIIRCLVKDPAHRYQTAEELRAELARRSPA
ncbi:MAG: serine/threonine protein kinase [Gemmatimonadota bacterium]|nr:MAG: serine/threonine protein kinase [Gemmatimonadota bacterium]